MDCRVWQVAGYRFWGGPIALQGFVQISDKKNSCNTKVVFNHFDRGSNDLKCLLEGKHVSNSLYPVALGVRPISGRDSSKAPGRNQLRCSSRSQV